MPHSVLLLVLLVLIGCGPSAPDKAQVEALSGATLGEPQRFGGLFDALLASWRSEIPNQMVVRTEDDSQRSYVWLYPLRADSSYRPPEASLLQCETEWLGEYVPTVHLLCRGAERDERGAWVYGVEFYPEYGSGTFSAAFTPE